MPGPLFSYYTTTSGSSRDQYLGEALLGMALRISKPLIDTRSSCSTGLLTGIKVAEPYSASNNGESHPPSTLRNEGDIRKQIGLAFVAD